MILIVTLNVSQARSKTGTHTICLEGCIKIYGQRTVELASKEKLLNCHCVFSCPPTCTEED